MTDKSEPQPDQPHLPGVIEAGLMAKADTLQGVINHLVDENATLRLQISIMRGHVATAKAEEKD